jgi:L-ascorbate metabolism protein UlaG (beta-lactamase superfamily)
MKSPGARAGTIRWVVQPSTPAHGRLVYVGHATVLIELDGVRLLTDPVLRSRLVHLRRRVPAPTEPLSALSAVLISHVHYDHLDLPSLRKLGRTVPVIVPRGARRAIRGFRDVRELRVGEEIRLGDVTVRAVPAEHRSARLPLFPSPAVGYVVSGSRTVYFAGDTDLFAGMAGLADEIDVALVPVAGWGPKVGPGHLDPARAAHAVQLLQPRIAVPIHWGTLTTLRAHASAEPPLEFARLTAERAPNVDVRVLQPGEALDF